MSHIEFLRKKRLLTCPLKRGRVEKEKLKAKNPHPIGTACFIAFLFFIIGAVYFFRYMSINFDPYYQQGKFFFDFGLFGSMSERTWFILKHSLAYGLTPALLGFVGFFFIPPVLKTIVCLATERKLPSRNAFKKYTITYRFLSLVAVAVVISFLLDTTAAYRHHIIEYGFDFSSGNISATPFVLEVLCILGILSFLVFKFMPKTEAKRKPSALSRLKWMFGKEDFGLYIGQSTGGLVKRHHQAGIAGSQAVVLGLKDASQNIISFGGIGEGKTTAIIYPLLIQLLDQRCGGLIFDIKGSFGRVVKTFADQLQRELTVIGIDKQAMNLLEGLQPETAAEYLRAALSLHGAGSGKEGTHWLESATALAESVLGILQFTPEHYTLKGVHDFIYNTSFREEAQKQASSLKLSGKNQRLLQHHADNYEHAFEGRYKEYKDSVLGTIDKVLKKFSHPDLTDSFCATGKGVKMPNMFDILDGKVFLVDMPLDRWGMSGNVVYMFLKLRYFNVIKERMANPELNQDKPVFFMCDEYQRIVDRSSSQLNADFNFWDKAREAKNIGIISSQSISSFYSAIGDNVIADAIMQNFRQKICLKTEDKRTIEYFEFLLGKVETGRRSYSRSEGRNKGEKLNSGSKHKGESESLSYIKESVIDSQVFRMLEPSEAIASLIIGNRAMDDVIKLYAAR